MQQFGIRLAIGASLLFTMSGIGYLTVMRNHQEVSVGLVTDVGGMAENSFSESIWNGIQQYQEIQPFAMNYLETHTNEQRLEVLNAQAQKNQIVVVPSAGFTDCVSESAKENPKTKYIFVDAKPVEPLDNVISVDFKEEQAGYLAGVVAAMTTKTNKIAFVGGEALSTVKDFGAGYMQGAKDVNPNIEVAFEMVNNFSDQQLGQQIANSLYQKDYDIIFAAAGLAGQGVIEAAKAYTQTVKPVWVIGVDYDQFYEGMYAPGKSVVLTSAIKHVDRAIEEMLAEVLNETAVFGTTQTLDIKTGAIGLPKTNPNLQEEAVNLAITKVIQALSTEQIKLATSENLTFK